MGCQATAKFPRRDRRKPLGVRPASLEIGEKTDSGCVHSVTIFSRDCRDMQHRNCERVLRAELFLKGQEDEEVLRVSIVFDVVR